MATLNVLRKVKVEGRWKMLPVKKDARGYDFSQVVNLGSPLIAAEGTFYLEWRDADGRKRRAVGTHPRQVKEALATQEKVIELRGKGMEVADAPQITERREMTGKSVADVIDGFKSTATMKYAKKSRPKYLNALLVFQRWAADRRKTHLSQIGREDLVDFMGYLVAQERLDHSTALDKGRVVHAILNRYGCDIRMKRGDWPRVTEQEIEVYENAVLERLFAASTPFEFVLYQTFRLTGFREQEVGFLSWDDFNARRRTLAVTEKKALGFRPKDGEERVIPVPDLLVELLEKHRKTQPEGTYLIFPTRSQKYRGNQGGQRDRHMLDRLKKLAKRAGLNCGKCVALRNKKSVSCADQPVCQKFGLHKFRHSFATTLLRDGVDLVSLQKLLGHSDLESTRKYLRALDPEDLHAKIARSSLATTVFSRG